MVFRHIVSNFSAVPAAIGSRVRPAALGWPYAHPRVDQLWIRGADAVPSGGGGCRSPTDNAIPAISGGTLYRVKNRVIDDGEFIPLR